MRRALARNRKDRNQRKLSFRCKESENRGSRIGVMVNKTMNSASGTREVVAPEACIDDIILHARIASGRLAALSKEMLCYERCMVAIGMLGNE